MTPLEKFFENPSFLDERNLSLWKSVLSSSNKPKTIKKSLTLNDYLPIEFLRLDDSIKFFKAKKSERQFLSSGTTASTRSISHFSHDGLLLYKLQSLKNFHEKLKKFYRDDSLKIKGISLIPNSSVWPTSSLAQMLTWFSEFWDLTFVESDNLKNINFGTDPIWIFATPFQLIDIFDSASQFQLPEKSILFETGGTKGKSREIKREELYFLISKHFNIPQTQIVSEYGMCELAAQAYDVEEKARRVFKFPPWVKTYTTPGLGIVQREGEGALLILDPLRIDYPLPLRTQDIVRLYKDGSFELLGRVPKSVLKGCSLLTEKPSKVRHHLTQKSSVPLGVTRKIMDQESFESILNTLEAELSFEFHSSNIAKSALADLRLSLKNCDIQKALKNSQAKKEHSLFIAPQNHSLALIYPIYMAQAAGMRITVRVPKSFSGKNSSLLKFLKHIPNVNLLSDDFRLGRNDIPKDISRIFVFGEDKTLAEISKQTSLPISGFGSGISMNVLKNPQKAQAKLLAKDMLSLAQRGCLSTRGLLTYGISWEELQKFLQVFQKECGDFCANELSIGEKVALDHESVSLSQEAIFYIERINLNDILIPVYKMNSKSRHPSTLLSERPFVFPIFLYESEDELLKDLQSFPSLLCISSNEKNLKSRLSVPFSQLGECNTPAWDGFHNGRPLFS